MKKPKTRKVTFAEYWNSIIIIDRMAYTNTKAKLWIKKNANVSSGKKSYRVPQGLDNMKSSFR